MNLRNIVCACAGALVVSFGTLTRAATLNWQGGDGNLTDSNYVDPSVLTPNQPFSSTGSINLGASSTIGNAVDTSVGRLFVGHNVTPDTGAATLNLNSGSVGTTAGASNIPGVIVGNAADGTLNLNGGTLVVNRLLTVGNGNSTTLNGYFNVASGAALFVNAGNVNVGDGTGGGLAGHVSFAGVGSVSSSLQLGVRRGSSWTQTGGSINFGASIIVGQGTADGSSLQLNSGTMTANTAFTVSDNSSATGPSNVSATITDGTISVGGAVNIAQGASSNNVSVLFNGNSYFSNGATQNMNVAAGANVANASVTFSGNTVVKDGFNFFIGVGTTTTGVNVNLSGNAQLNVGNRFLMGGLNSGSLATNNITMNHSGGTLTTILNLSVGDQGGYATYNLSGTGVITTTTGAVIGRQGYGQFFQSGGTTNFNGGFQVGDNQSDVDLSNTGLYQISAGTFNTTAVSIGTNGTGTFQVVGGDGVINASGNVTLGNTARGKGALLYTLQNGESLSEIMAAGTASFAAGTFVTIDDAGNTPTQVVYDLLTATSITDNGLILQAPPNWTYAIVPGGNGQILQVTVPEPSSLAALTLSSIVLLRRRRGSRVTRG